MVGTEIKEVTDKAIEKGGVLAILYFDMQSQKSDDLQPIMADMINNKLMKSKGVLYCYGSIEEPLKVEDVYSTTATVNILFDGMASMMNVIFNFVPAGIEIVRPEKEFTISISALQSVMLALSQISVEYSHYIMGKVLKKDDFEELESLLKKREELGKKLLGRNNNTEES
jgi:hypothetical protein